MNTVTKRDARGADPLQLATGNSLQWAQTNRRSLLLFSGIALAVLAVLLIGYGLYQHASNVAQADVGEAMQTYQTPLVRPDQPLPPDMKSFNTAKERATRANAQFLDVANHHGLTEPGKLALYFAGITYMEADQNGPAEDTLKKVSGSMNGDTAALGKMALAELYQETNRSDQAIALYQELAKGHAATVPPGLAQLQLAALYNAEGKTEDARRIYAELKDHDKDAKGKLGVAAQVASEKLNPTPAGPALPRR